MAPMPSQWLQRVTLPRQIQPLQEPTPPRATDTEQSHRRAPEVYVTESVCKVVLQKSIPAQIRQLILYYY